MYIFMRNLSIICAKVAQLKEKEIKLRANLVQFCTGFAQFKKAAQRRNR
jgi:hypothetical protein